MAKNIKLSTKMMLMCFAIVLVLIVLGGINTIGNISISSATEQNNILHEQRAIIQKMIEHNHVLLIGVMDVIGDRGSGAINNEITHTFAENSQFLEENLRKLMGTTDFENQNRIIANIETNLDLLIQEITITLPELVKQYSDPEADHIRVDASFNEIENRIDGHAEAITNGLSQVEQSIIDDVSVAKTEMIRQLSRNSFLSIATVILSIIGITIGSLFFTRSVVRSLNTVIIRLDSGAEQVTAASGQLSSSSQQIAEGASEQASSFEEISSSLDEMTSTTRQNAENAKQANTSSHEAQAAAEKGTQAMTRMNDAIHKIKASSDETAKIVKTIDEIAFQTNLLALNAAVEAARAGEAGMGFAIVAEEVRNLAHRSATAAKTTAALLDESQSNADSGVLASQEVAEIFANISGVSTRVSQLIDKVSTATEEQAQGIAQINTAISQMDQFTQANAANAEESASASEEMSSQAQEMNGLVQVLVNIVGNAENRRRNSRKAETTRTKISETVSIQPRVLTAAPHTGAAFTTYSESIMPLDNGFEDI